jgi:tetratricopeptide (TPR) repeat protein
MKVRTQLLASALLLSLLTVVGLYSSAILTAIPVFDGFTTRLPMGLRVNIANAILLKADSTDYSNKTRLLERATTIDPHNAQAWRLLCENYSHKYARGQADTPIKVCRAYFQLDKSATGHLLMGRALTRTFNAKGNCEALPYFEKALSLDSSSHGTLWEVGWSAGLCGEFKKSAEALETHAKFLEQESPRQYQAMIRTDRIMLSYVYSRLGNEALATAKK